MLGFESQTSISMTGSIFSHFDVENQFLTNATSTDSSYERAPGLTIDTDIDQGSGLTSGDHLEMAMNPSFLDPVFFDEYLNSLNDQKLSDLVADLSKDVPAEEEPILEGISDGLRPLNMNTSNRNSSEAEMDHRDTSPDQINLSGGPSETGILPGQVNQRRLSKPEYAESNPSDSTNEGDLDSQSNMPSDNAEASRHPHKPLSEGTATTKSCNSDDKDEINAHGLTNEEIQSLDEFSNLFLRPRTHKDSSLLYDLLSFGGESEEGSHSGPDPRDIYTSGLNNFSKSLDGIIKGKLECWNLPDKQLNVYLQTAKSAIPTKPILVDRVSEIIDHTCDPMIRRLLYPYLDASKFKVGKMTEGFSESLSIYHEIENTPERDRSFVWFPKMPLQGQKMFSEIAEKDGKTYSNLDDTRVILSKLAVRTTSTTPRTISTHTHRRTLDHMIDRVERLHPDLKDQIACAKSALDKVTLKSRNGKLYPPVTGCDIDRPIVID